MLEGVKQEFCQLDEAVNENLIREYEKYLRKKRNLEKEGEVIEAKILEALTNSQMPMPKIEYDTSEKIDEIFISTILEDNPYIFISKSGAKKYRVRIPPFPTQLCNDFSDAENTRNEILMKAMADPCFKEGLENRIRSSQRRRRGQK